MLTAFLMTLCILLSLGGWRGQRRSDGERPERGGTRRLRDHCAAQHGLGGCVASIRAGCGHRVGAHRDAPPAAAAHRQGKTNPRFRFFFSESGHAFLSLVKRAAAAACRSRAARALANLCPMCVR